MLRGSRAIASLPATAKLHEPMASQTAVDARARRHGVEAPTGELVLYPAGAPTGVLPSELTDQRLHLRSDLVRTRGRPVGTVGEGCQPACLVAGDPGVDGLPRHSETIGDLDNLPAILDHRQHRLVPLLHDAELHQHGPPPERDGRCQASAEATVNDQPEPVSRISRNSVKDQVTPERQASPGTRHLPVHPAGQYSKKYPQVEGHVLRLSGRHAKLRREGYRRREHR
jgi:hypothetical protein